jgi:hypothetical protein
MLTSGSGCDIMDPESEIANSNSGDTVERSVFELYAEIGHLLTLSAGGTSEDEAKRIADDIRINATRIAETIDPTYWDRE